MTKDWIVMHGQPIDTTKGGGFEFFGPFTEPEALRVRNKLCSGEPYSKICVAIQLLQHKV